MATNLTGATIASTYSQLLHVDSGPEATEKVVYSGTGVATALKVGTQSASVDNLKLDGNTIASTNTNGDINITPNGTGTVVIPKINIQAGSVTSDDVDITGGSITNVVFTGTFTGITLIESEEFHTVNGGDGLQITDNTILADGSSTDIDINFTTKNEGEVNITGKFGYAAGNGGTVSQATSKSTGVTLDKLSGQITMNAAQLNRNTGVSFVLTNSFIAATDVVFVCIASGATADVYTATIDAVSAGSCRIHLHNHSTGTDLSEAVVLNFVVIKGVSA
jgi:hypothetical protein